MHACAITATILSAVLLIGCLATPILALQGYRAISAYGMINLPSPTPPLEYIKTFYKRGVMRSELVEDFQESYFHWKQHHEVERDYDKMKNEYNIEVVRVMLNKDFWTNNVVLPKGDIDGVVKPYQSIVDDIVSWCSARGMYLILESWTTEYWTQPLESAAQRMYNYPEDFFIDWITEVASRYSDEPYVIMGLVNEPANRPAGIYDTVEKRMVRWREICITAIERIRAVKPVGYIIVQPVAFRAVQQWSGRLLPFSDIIYGIHDFYHWDLGSIVGKPYSPHPYAVAYWEGRFEEGKQKLEQWLQHIAFNLLNEGVPVFVDEFGAWVPDNNWDVWLRDFYDICRKYQVGWTQLWWHGYWTEEVGTPTRPDIDYHLLKHDWETLSPIGEVWAEEMK